MQTITVKKFYFQFTGLMSLFFMCSMALAADYVSDAKEAIAKKEYNTAIIHLKNQLKQSPDDAIARYLLGTSYQKTGNFSGAFKELEKAYEVDKENDKIKLAYASLLQLKNEHEKIKIILSESFENQSEESERLVILGGIALSENKLADAADLFNKAKSINNTSEVQIAFARLAFAEKDTIKAEQIINGVLNKDALNQTALYFKVLILNKKKEYQQSIDILDALLEEEPRNLRFLLERAGIKNQLKDYKGVEQDLSVILKQNDSNPSANSLMSLSKLYQNEYALAKEYAQKVLNLLPNHYVSMFVRGLAEFGLGNLNLSEKYLTQVLFQYPDNLDVQNVLANVYIAKNEGEQAMLILESIEHDVIAENAKLLLTLGTAYLLTGDIEKAMDVLNKAKKLAPNNKLIADRLVTGYLKTSDSQNAVVGLESIAEDKENKFAQYALVMAYIQQKELDKASSVVEKFQKQAPNDPNIYNLQAALHLLNKNQKSAMESYYKALEKNENYIPAYLGMVRIHMANRQYDQADVIFKKILSINEKFIKAWIGRASIAEKSGENEKVEWFLKEGLNQVKGDFRSELSAFQQLAKWYIKQDQKARVLELGRDLSQRYPNESSALYFQVKALMLNEKSQKTEVLLERLINSDPDNRKFQLLLASVLVDNKDYERALNRLENLLESNSDDRQALLLKGNVLTADGQYEKATLVSRHFQQLYPQMEEGYQLEANVLLAEKKYAKALEKYKIAFQRGANNQILVKIISIYIIQKKANEAIDFLTRIIAKDDANLVARYRLAIILEYLKKNALAIEQYLAILEHEPENVLILNNLAWLLSEQGDQQAMQFAQKAYKLQPGSPAVADTYGYILLKQGRVVEGIGILEKAASAAPEAYDIHYHLAKGYYLNGENQKAKEKLAAILSAMTKFSEQENAKTLFNQLQ